MSTEQNKIIARRWVDELFTVPGNLEAAEEFIAADMVDHAAPPGLPSGREGVVQIAELFRTAFPDLRASVEDIVAEGDKVVVRWSGGGTHRGPLFGIPASGTAVTADGILIFRIANGQIAERWANSDDLGMMRQLGVVP